MFLTFAKIGAFTFGGGLAMLGILQEEVVNRHGWATEDELLDYYAISQCTPGIIAVNTATFIGYKHHGIPGAIVTTAGVVFPSLVIIMIIAAFIKNFMQYEIVQHIFAGIRVAVAVLIVNAVFTMGKKSVTDAVGIAAAAVSCILSFVFSLSPVWLVIAGALAGLISKHIKEARK